MWSRPAGRAVPVLLGFLAAACGAAPRESRDPDMPMDDAAQVRNSTPVGPDRLVLHLELPARAARGAPVPIRLALENRGDAPVTVGLGGRPVAFDFVVARPDGAEVWSRLHGQAIAAVLQERRLAPGEVLHFQDSWDQRDNQGRQVPPGRYLVWGVLPVADQPRGEKTGSVQLVVLP